MLHPNHNGARRHLGAVGHGPLLPLTREGAAAPHGHAAVVERRWRRLRWKRLVVQGRKIGAVVEFVLFGGVPVHHWTQEKEPCRLVLYRYYYCYYNHYNYYYCYCY